MNRKFFGFCCRGRDGGVLDAGAGYKGNCPYEGSVVRSMRGSGARRESPLRRAGVVLARSESCLATAFAFFNVFCLRRGRRVLLGAAAPRSTPFQPPPTTPLGFPGGHCSHGSVGSWEEPTRTTLARKGRYEALPVEPRPVRRRAVLSRAASGEEPWANGAWGKGRGERGGAVTRSFAGEATGCSECDRCARGTKRSCWLGAAVFSGTRCKHHAPPKAPPRSPAALML